MDELQPENWYVFWLIMGVRSCQYSDYAMGQTAEEQQFTSKQGQEIFLFSTGPTLLLEPRCTANHSPPSSVKVKNVPPPHIIINWYLIKYMSFTFTLHLIHNVLTLHL